MNEDCRTTAEEAVVGGVDTHKDVHVAAVLGSMGALLGTCEFPATLAGHADLLRWIASFGNVSSVGVAATTVPG